MQVSFAEDVSETARHHRFPVRSNVNLAGTSFKPQNARAILSDADARGFFEVHAENYMGAGGIPHRVLESLRKDHPISLHGVCMSIGGSNRLDKKHLQRFSDLVSRYEPFLVSEHLAWSTHNGTYFNDLLPLPYTQNTLARVCDHIDEVQRAIGGTILLENPSSYLSFDESTLSETDFLHAITRRTGCALLLDINNVFVSAANLGFSSQQYLDEFPMSHVGEIHLAGHTAQNDSEIGILLIDSHNGPVSNPVWDLYKTVVQTTGPIPTLIEWDSNIPSWPTLKTEAQAAQVIMDSHACHRNVGQSHAA